MRFFRINNFSVIVSCIYGTVFLCPTDIDRSCTVFRNLRYSYPWFRCLFLLFVFLSVSIRTATTTADAGSSFSASCSYISVVYDDRFGITCSGGISTIACASGVPSDPSIKSFCMSTTIRNFLSAIVSASCLSIDTVLPVCPVFGFLFSLSGTGYRFPHTV